MEYDCLTKNGEFVVAKPRGWKWSKRELAEFDCALHKQSVVSISDQPVTLPNGVKTTMAKIDKALVEENLTDTEIKTAKDLLVLNGYDVTKAVV